MTKMRSYLLGKIGSTCLSSAKRLVWVVILLATLTSLRAQDITAPSAASDLSAAPASSAGAMYLSWSVPGNDLETVALGAGSLFYLQYSTYTEVAWSTSTAQLNFSAAGAVPGELQYRAVSGLLGNTSYYFRIWTMDGAGNCSQASNEVAGLTAIETPSDIYFDEISSNSIVASAYVPSPAFMNLHLGRSGTNVAINNNAWSWAGWHGEAWTTKASMPTARSGFTAAAVNGKLYAQGGAESPTSNEEYDPEQDVWNVKASMPAGRSSFGSAATGGRIFVFGGARNLNLNQQYDPVADTWENIPGVKVCPGEGVVSVGEKMYALGGACRGWIGIGWGSRNYFTQYAAINQEYDVSAKVWARRQDMPTSRGYLAAAASSGKIYAVGGVTGFNYGRAVNSNEEYDPAFNSWTVRRGMSEPRINLTAAALGGKVYAIGGDNSAGRLNTNEEYDPVSDTWVLRQHMPTARTGVAAAAIGGRIYVVGGADTVALNVNEEYDPGIAAKFGSLTPNTRYTFKAKARNQAGVETAESGLFSACTLATVALPQNGESIFSLNTSSGVLVRWSSGTASGGFNGPGAVYNLEVSSYPDFSAQPLQYSSGGTSLYVYGLTPGLAYHYRVRAANLEGVWGDYLELGSAVYTAPGPARSFNVTVSTDPILAGSDINMTVTAKDSFQGSGNTVGYLGTVNFHVDGVPGSPEVMDDDTITDSIHGLPQQYTFVPGDHGSKTFQIRLRKAGIRSLRVEDSFDYGVYGTRNVHVSPASPGYYKITPSSDTIVSPFPGIQELTVQLADAFGNSISSAGVPAYFAISEVHGSTGAIQSKWWSDIGASHIMYTDSLGRIANETSLVYRVSGQRGDWARVWVGTVPINQESYPAYAEAGQNLSGRLITGNPRSAILTPCPGCVFPEELILSGVVSDEVLSRGQNWKAEFLIFRDTAPINYENRSINYGGWDKSGYFWNGSTWTPVSEGPVWLQAETDAPGNWRYSGLTCDTKTEHKTGTCWARGERYDAWLRVTDNDGNVESARTESQRFYIANKTESFRIISATHAYTGDGIYLRVAAVIEPGGEGDIAPSYDGSVNFYLDGVQVGPEARNIDNVSIEEPGLPQSYSFRPEDYGIHPILLRFSKPGENRTLMVQDAADPEITGSVSITVEAGYPSVKILAPANAPYLASLTQLSGTAADNKAVAAVEVSLQRQPDGFFWGGGGWAETQAWLRGVVFSSSWTFSNIPALADGVQYTVVARAKDTYGNWSVVYDTSSFVYDAAVPVSAVTVPAVGEVASSFSAVSGTAADLGSAPGRIWVSIKRLADDHYWNGEISQWAVPEAWNLAQGSATWRYAGLSEADLASGTAYFTVSRAADLAGNVQVSQAWGSTFTYVAAHISSAPFRGVTENSLTVNWESTFSSGTIYYVRLCELDSADACIYTATTTAFSSGFTGLNANSRYYGYVSTAPSSGYRFAGSGVTLAIAPSSAAFSGVGYSSAVFGWSGGANPADTSYNFEVSPSTSFSVITVSGTGTAMSAGLAGLTESMTYYGRARAVNSEGVFSAFGAVASVSTLSLPQPPAQLAAPSGSVLGVSSIAWSWSELADVTGYNVYSSTAPSALMTSLLHTAYLFEGLAPNTTYSIMVAGVNSGGEGPLSLSSAVFTMAAVPSAPFASMVGLSSAVLNWELNGNPAGTVVELWRASGDVNYVSVFSGPAVSYADTGLEECSHYSYKLRGRNGAGIYSDFSLDTSFATDASAPAAPGGLYAGAQADAHISLNWDFSPGPAVTQYKLYFDSATGTIDYSTPYAVFSSTVSAWTTPALNPGSTYMFGLRALNRCGIEEKNTSVLTSTLAVGALSGVRAVIKVPQTGKRVNGNSVTVIAELVAGTPAETSNVRFQYKASSGGWLDVPAKDPAIHPNPDAISPYFIHWDVATLAAGSYQLRAVATDLRDTADSLAEAITITVNTKQSEINENSSGDKATKEQEVHNFAANTLQAADPVSSQITKLEIPAGALNAPTATVAITNKPAVAPPPPADAEASGIVTEVVLSNQSLLAGGRTAVVTLLYPDADNNGIVDGTTLLASQLEMYSAHSAAGPWERDLKSVVDLAGKKVTGHTTHFSFFALFAPQAINFNAARAYPLPWRPGSGGKFDSAPGTYGITFDNLPGKTEIKIFTIGGQLVRELKLTAADLGVKVWDGKNSAGVKAASGVYLAHIKSGSSVKVLKIAVER